MNAEKLKKLQAQVRIGGKGTPRRKKKIVHSTPATDDKKLQSSLKRLPVNIIPGIEEGILSKMTEPSYILIIRKHKHHYQQILSQ